MRPNLVVGVEDGESNKKKWYFEVAIDHIEQVTHIQPHIRIGWATTHFQPSPGHADGFSSNGIGDNTYSYGFDGQNIWFAGRAYNVSYDDIERTGFRKNDVIGCLLDLNVPEICFSLNGIPVKGFISEFNLTGMFYPAISLSSRVRLDKFHFEVVIIFKIILVVDLYLVVNMVIFFLDYPTVQHHFMKLCY
jgi:ryanodine receptor 2